MSSRVIVDEANAFISLTDKEVFVKVFLEKESEEETSNYSNLDIGNEYVNVLSPNYVLMSQDDYADYISNKEYEISTNSIDRYESMINSVPVSEMLDDGEPEIYDINIRETFFNNVITVTILDTEPNTEYDIEMYPRED